MTDFFTMFLGAGEGQAVNGRRSRRPRATWNQYSITITKIGEDITDGEVDHAKAFFEDKCTRWLIGIESGQVEGRKHMQCVVESDGFPSARALHSQLRIALGWQTLGKKSRVCVKGLRQNGVHTFSGMIGYCMKYQAEDTPERPFEYHCGGISAEDIAEGKTQYMMLGKPNKHSILLDPANIIDKAHMFASLKLRGVVAPDFDKTIGMMVSSRKYVLSSKWCKPNSGLDSSLTALVWKSRTALHAFTGEDLGRTLYGNPTYRYHHIEPEIMKVPLVEREDFYDCHEDFQDGEGEAGDGEVSGRDEEVNVRDEEVSGSQQEGRHDEEDIFCTPESDTEGETHQGGAPSSWARIQGSLQRIRHRSPRRPHRSSSDELADELGLDFVPLS
jgi:hypothetical protein